MSRVFVDTSAVLALLIGTDESHDAALRVFETLRDREAALVTTSYHLVETYALLDRRFGADACARFRADFAPLLDVVWVDAGLHEAALDLKVERPARVSLVDATAFVCMREERIDEAFAFDRHFDREGLRVL